MDSENCEAIEKFRQAVAGSIALQEQVRKIKSNPELVALGKENGYEKNLRDWFKLIYEVVFGEANGPRMGFFISFFGLNETIKLISDKIK